jgi:hypothetical protein
MRRRRCPTGAATGGRAGRIGLSTNVEKTKSVRVKVDKYRELGPNCAWFVTFLVVESIVQHK